MKNYNLYQCDLEKNYGEHGKLRTTSFLPDQFAVEGKVLEIMIGVKWSNGWVVTKVYKQNKRTYEDAVKWERDYKRTREASDV